MAIQPQRKKRLPSQRRKAQARVRELDRQLREKGTIAPDADLMEVLGDGALLDYYFMRHQFKFDAAVENVLDAETGAPAGRIRYHDDGAAKRFQTTGYWMYDDLFEEMNHISLEMRCKRSYAEMKDWISYHGGFHFIALRDGKPPVVAWGFEDIDWLIFRVCNFWPLEGGLYSGTNT